MQKLGDPVPRLDSIVDWQAFRPLLTVIHQEQRKSNAGRKPHDVTWTFKMLPQSLYNLFDVHPNQSQDWKKRLVEGAEDVFGGNAVEAQDSSISD